MEPMSSFCLLLDDRLHQLLGVTDLLDDQRNVERRPSRHAGALTIDAVLSDHCQRVGEQVHRHREATAADAHHRFVNFERVAVLFEGPHLTLSSAASPDGLRVRWGPSKSTA